MTRVQLGRFNNSWYHPGRGRCWQAAWFLLGLPVLRSAWIPSSGLRVRLLRSFGARLGDGVVIKPGVRVKYPWRLTVGRDCWLGEDCWIDNLANVVLGNNVCVSQGAYLCTGNHDWSDPSFGLMLGPITLADGCWVGAGALLAPGVTLGEHAVAAAGSVVAKSIPAWKVYAGNPAVFVRQRSLSEEPSGGRASAAQSPAHVQTKSRLGECVL